MINIMINYMLFSEWAVGSRVSCGLTYVRLGDESNVVGAGHRMYMGVWGGCGGGGGGGGATWARCSLAESVVVVEGKY